MKFPDSIPEALTAPCGILCTLCHRHCEDDPPCPGCRDGKGVSKHCQECVTRRCAAERGYRYCMQCAEFPCHALRDFDESYRARFGHVFLPNAIEMKAHGADAMLRKLRADWTCPDCGGVVCIHNDTCSECGRHCDVPASI